MVKKRTQGLQGIGNSIYHQNIISDLIFGVRKKLLKQKLSKKYKVVSEISIKQLENEDFTKNHNIDFVVYENHTGFIKFIVEVERSEKISSRTKHKLKDCLRNMKHLEEAFVVSFDNNGVQFLKCELEKDKLKIATKNNSRSNFLKMNLKSSIVSRIQL